MLFFSNQKIMQKPLKNYAFIDGQNLYKGIKELGWKLDFVKFRIYLNEKYAVKKAYIFIGYIKQNQPLYKSLKRWGYILIFKLILQDRNKKIKGNCDADLVLQAMIDYKKYNKAVIVTSDGDFYRLIKYLKKKRKLEKVLSSHKKYCSSLLRKTAQGKIDFMNDFKERLAYKKKKHL